MYCCHCGKKIDEEKIEKQKLSLALHEGKIDENTKVSYVCPRCGHLIHPNVDEKEVKTLAAASHAEIQRGRNSIAGGMSSLCIGGILLILAIIFFFLAKKPANDFVLSTTCPEFFVSMICFAFGGVLFVVGLVLAILGWGNKRLYERLLQDIQAGVFHQ